MRIVFMGTPDFARESLEALYNTKNEIILVVTNPDKKSGRGMKVIKSPVKEFAEEKNLNILQPEKIKNNESFVNELKNLKPDLLVVVAYGKILPKDVLDIPKYGAVNVHGSLLPKYRGSAPIQWAIINGEKETGITTMFMDENMDTGDIILEEKISISDDETTGKLWKEMAKAGGKLLVKTIEKIENALAKIDEENIIKNQLVNKNNGNELLSTIKTEMNVTKQGNDYTLAPMLKKEMSKIDWNKNAYEIKNLIRGLDPIMGTYTYYDSKKIKIWKAEVIKQNENLADIEIQNYKNGEVILSDKKKGLYIKAGENTILSILEIQAENSKRVNIKDFLNGNKIETHSIFE